MSGELPKLDSDFPKYELVLDTDTEVWYSANESVEALYKSGRTVKMTGKVLEMTGIVRPISQLERAGLSAHYHEINSKSQATD